MLKIVLLLTAFMFVAGCSYYKNTTFEERMSNRKKALKAASEAAKTGADVHETLTGKDTNVREKIEAIEPAIDIISE